MLSGRKMKGCSEVLDMEGHRCPLLAFGRGVQEGHMVTAGAVARTMYRSGVGNDLPGLQPLLPWNQGHVLVGPRLDVARLGISSVLIVGTNLSCSILACVLAEGTAMWFLSETVDIELRIITINAFSL